VSINGEIKRSCNQHADVMRKAWHSQDGPN
jgi:hypothetical protein